MCCCSGTDEVEDAQAQHGADQGNGLAVQPQLVQVGLNGGNVVNQALPEVFYVIIGRGPMAVVNHRTLRATQWGIGRIDGHQVLHLGAPNPWPEYMRHGLGQPNHLLSFPGFTNQPSQQQAVIDGGLDSQVFGQCIDQEFGLLPQGPPPRGVWVALIQSENAAGQIDNRIPHELDGGAQVSAALTQRAQDPWPQFPQGAAPYRLVVFDPIQRQAALIYASAIDICTGPGRPNVFAPANGDSPETVAARTPPWLSPELWAQNGQGIAEQQDRPWLGRATLNGVDAIRDEVAFQANQRICVTAGGGVGLNAAEKSRNNQCVLDWFGRTGLMPIFLNPRNTTFLRDLNAMGQQPDFNDDPIPCDGQAGPAAYGINGEDDLYAISPRHRMGRGGQLAAAAANQGGGVDVTLQVFGQAAVIRDRWGQHSGLANGAWAFSGQYQQEVQAINLQPGVTYTRLVIPNGQSAAAIGHSESLAGHLGLAPVVEAGRMVALATQDGLVRVLGAACNNYAGFNQNAQGNAHAVAMWQFHATLPICAVPDGFIICGVNTAAANRYFQANPNRNVNTMTRDEIMAVVQDGPTADRIVQHRNGNNGYANRQDLVQSAQIQDTPALDQFAYAYPVV